MADVPPFPYAMMTPLAIRLRQRLGYSLRIRDAWLGHPKRIIAKLDRDFELCDREGQKLF